MFFFIWLFVAFTGVFFMWKKHGEAFKKKVLPENGSYYGLWLEEKEFYLIFIIPITWPIGLPGYLMW